MRIIGRPHDLMWPDVVGQRGNAALDRLERDPAVALEEFARTRLRGGIVDPVIVEMPVHAIDPRRDPAAARFQKRDAQARVAIDHAAPDHGHRRQHHLHRVRNHVARRAVALEAVDADSGYRIGRALVKADRKAELLGHRPERLVHGIIYHLLPVIRVRPQKAAAHPELFARIAHLLDRKLDRLHRQHRDPEQPVWVRLAVIREPAVVGAAPRRGELRVLDRPGEETEARIKEGGVDPVRVHIDDAGMRIEPALLPFGIFETVELDVALADADRAEAADPARIAEQFALDAEALLTVFVNDEARPALAERRVYVLIP